MELVRNQLGDKGSHQRTSVEWDTTNMDLATTAAVFLLVGLRVGSVAAEGRDCHLLWDSHHTDVPARDASTVTTGTFWPPVDPTNPGADAAIDYDCAACTTVFHAAASPTARHRVAYGCHPAHTSCAQAAEAEGRSPKEEPWKCCEAPDCNAPLITRFRVIACFHGDPEVGYSFGVLQRSPLPAAPRPRTSLASSAVCSVCWGTELGERGCDFGDLGFLTAYYNTTRGRFEARGSNVSLCATNFCNHPPHDAGTALVHGYSAAPAAVAAALPFALLFTLFD